jgi:pimeloyl-ACP methyl ester carboxylesterase
VVPDARRRLLRRAAVVAALAFLPAIVAAEPVDITATDGVQLRGDLAGTGGPGVVLVQSAARDRAVWDATAEALVARGFRVLRFDLRSRGGSGGTAAAVASERDVDGAYRYVVGRKIRPVLLVGEGDGGRAALAVAMRLPVAGLVLVGMPEIGTASDVRVPVLRLPGLDALASPADFDRLAAFLRAPTR